MSYLPWIAGGAALGYAARSGRRAAHDDDYQKVKGSFRRQIVEGPWGTKTMQVSSVRQRRWHSDLSAYYLKEPAYKQRGSVRHQGFAYGVERGYDFDFRDLPWKVYGEGRKIESTRFFDAQTEAAADAWLLGMFTPNRYGSPQTYTVHQVSYNLAEMAEMGYVPPGLYAAISRHGGYWDRLSSTDKKRWTTEARGTLRRLERAGKITQIPGASPATWRLQ